MRLFKRYLGGNSTFIALVFRELRHRHRPAASPQPGSMRPSEAVIEPESMSP